MRRLAAALASSVLLLPGLAQAAVFAIEPSAGSYASGRTFTLQVAVSSPDQAVNAVSGVIGFSNDLLQVMNVTHGASIVDVWVHEPNFSNAAGTVSFEGAILNPGYQGGSGNLLTITFRALKPGSAQVAFRSGSILANDGLGTNVFKGLTGSRFTLTEAPVSAPAASKPAASGPASSGAAGMPDITSDTHPSPDVWSKSQLARFSWQLPEDATGVQYGLDRVQAGQSGSGTEGRIASVSVPLDAYSEDGAYYFHLRFLKGDEAGPVQTRRILVDRVPPETFEVSQFEPGDPTEPRREFHIDASDASSGLDHLEVSWDGGQLRVPADAIGRFMMPPLPPGSNDITLRAFDKAGNVRSSHAFIHIDPIPSPTLEVVLNADQQASILERAFVPFVRGRAEPGNNVLVTFTPRGDAAREVSVPVDQSGSWQLPYAPLALGSWDITAVAQDKRGARSLVVGPIHVSSTTFWSVALEALPWVIAVALAVALGILLYRRKNNLGDEVRIALD